MATAVLSRSSGRAIVREEDGRIFILEHDKPSPENAAGVHLGMFLQPAMTRLEEQDAGQYPYQALHEYLKLAYLQEITLSMILSSLDASLSRSLRLAAAKEAVTGLSNEKVRIWIESVFKKMPLPAIADKAGLPHKKLKEFVLNF